jgi:hypothetical protein
LVDVIRKAWIGAEGREAYAERVALAVAGLEGQGTAGVVESETEEQYRERRRAEIAERQRVAAARVG